MSETETLDDLSAQLREALGLGSEPAAGAEAAPAETPPESENQEQTAERTQSEETTPSESLSPATSDQETPQAISQESEVKAQAESVPILEVPETIPIGDRRVSYKDVVEAYNLWTTHSDMLRKSAALLREIDERMADPLWFEAFKTLLSEEWRQAVLEEGEEGESEDDFLSFGETPEEPESRSETPKPSKSPQDERVAALQLALLESHYRQGEAEFQRYAKELEEKYGSLSKEDWARIADIVDRYAILTPDGWWEPRHGNPLELAARLDPVLQERVRQNGEVRKRQAVDDATTAGSSSATEQQTSQKTGKIDELASLIRDAYF